MCDDDLSESFDGFHNEMKTMAGDGGGVMNMTEKDGE
jgi:hypothetical protein